MLALWKRCNRVLGDDEATGWIRSRALDPAAVEDFDLARVLPSGEPIVRWARSTAGSWRASGHRLVLPLWDASGEFVSVRARCLRADAKPAKALAPCGFAVAGLVLADSLAVCMLAGESDAIAQVRDHGLVVTEGEPDFLVWATMFSDANEDAPAVLGLVAGSWSRALAARIPDGTRVAVRTHSDETGDRYADAVTETLISRCRIHRGGAA